MPRKLVAQQGGLGTGKMVRLGNYCGSARWSRQRKDDVPRFFCVFLHSPASVEALSVI